MKPNKYNDIIDTLRKENPKFDLQMYVHISDAIKNKELDNDIALGLHTGYRSLMKRGRKMALISAIILLASIAVVAIPLYQEINGVGNGTPAWLDNLPAVAAIPVGILWMFLLLYCFATTMNAMLGWGMMRHICKYYPHLFENILKL